MVSVLIIEDNLMIREQLAKDISAYGVEIVQEASTSKEAKSMLMQYTPDIIFFDINLPDANGFALAEQISLSHSNIGIIFITGDANFAHKAFEIEAIDYLMKPFSKERLRECMKKAYAHLNISGAKVSPSKSTVLSVKVSNGIELLEQNEIIYLEAGGKSTKIKMIGSQGKMFQTTDSLKSIESRLDPDIFIRTHRSYIVNVNHVQRIEPSGQTNIIYFKTCKDVAYLSKSYTLSLYKKINYR